MLHRNKVPLLLDNYLNELMTVHLKGWMQGDLSGSMNIPEMLLCAEHKGSREETKIS